MKSRNGFVSNSSSSSFIIRIDDVSKIQLIEIVNTSYTSIDVKNGIIKINESSLLKDYLDKQEIPYDIDKY